MDGHRACHPRHGIAARWLSAVWLIAPSWRITASGAAMTKGIGSPRIKPRARESSATLRGALRASENHARGRASLHRSLPMR
jgi:hypothetical protein